jgi:hypothetical protein
MRLFSSAIPGCGTVFGIQQIEKNLTNFQKILHCVDAIPHSYEFKFCFKKTQWYFMTNKPCYKHQKLDSLNKLFVKQKTILKGKCRKSMKICTIIYFYIKGFKLFVKIQ